MMAHMTRAYQSEDDLGVSHKVSVVAHCARRDDDSLQPDDHYDQGSLEGEWRTVGVDDDDMNVRGSCRGVAA